MPNKNYVKGRRYEYKIVNKLKSAGLPIVARTAGSHSPIDIFAIDILKRQIYLYQCKPKSMSKNAKDKIEEQWNSLNNIYAVKFKVI